MNSRDNNNTAAELDFPIESNIASLALALGWQQLAREAMRWMEVDFRLQNEKVEVSDWLRESEIRRRSASFTIFYHLLSLALFISASYQ